MYLQHVLAFSVALLAGTSIAADYNGGQIPSNLRKGWSKLRAADLAPGSSSVEVLTIVPNAFATPRSSFVANTSKAKVSMSSVAKATSAAVPSSIPSSSFRHAAPNKFQYSARPSRSVAASSSSSVAHRQPQATHAGQRPADTHPVSIPVQVLASQADSAAHKDAHKPFWSRPVSDSRRRPNAPDFSQAPEMQVNDKDSCSLRCQDLANQCVDLLPKDNDFCWENYPSCQDLCVKEHVDSSS